MTTVSAEDARRLGTILGVWAHPDDESWCAAGLLAQAVKNGQRVICVTATHGEGGKTTDELLWPQNDLANIRSSELAAALDILGVKEHHWLDGYEDGKLRSTDPSAAITKLTELIKTAKPDTILTFGPDGLTGHDDHKTVFKWARQAVSEAGSRAKIYSVAETAEKYALVPEHLRKTIYFNIKKPNLVPESSVDLVFRLPPEIHKLKLAALRDQPSQMAVFFKTSEGAEFINEYSKTEVFRIF